MDMKTQVCKEHYEFNNYVDWRRWHSYFYQIDEALKADCQDYLVIGVGDGIVPYVLKKNGKNVDTFDYDSDLNPTYSGDLKRIGEVVTKKYDCVICCQVLEHIEFEYFEEVLDCLSNICINRIIISLPVKKTEFSIYLDVPKRFVIKKLCIVIPKFWIKRFQFDGQHYWEVGTREYPKKRIREIVNKPFRIVRDYHVPGYTYHWFIVADSR